MTRQRNGWTEAELEKLGRVDGPMTATEWRRAFPGRTMRACATMRTKIRAKAQLEEK